MKTKISTTGLLLAGIMLAGQTAIATPLTLSAGSGSNFDGATGCIFAGSGIAGCPIVAGSSGAAPAAMPTGAPGGSYSGDSWTYTVNELVTLLGGDNTFNIIIDSNWAGSTPGDSEYLDLFQVFVNGSVAFDYTAGAYLDDGANGTGNENWLLSTVDLSSFAMTDQLYFHIEMSELTDGAEQVALLGAGFVTPPNPCDLDPQAPGCQPPDPCDLDPQAPGCQPPGPTPEPGVLLLLSAGLLGMACRRRSMN